MLAGVGFIINHKPAPSQVGSVVVFGVGSLIVAAFWLPLFLVLAARDE